MNSWLSPLGNGNKDDPQMLGLSLSYALNPLTAPCTKSSRLQVPITMI